MRALVIGLGSMGKRRVRNLLSLGNIEISGFDVRQDRCDETHVKYGITILDSIDTAFDHHKFDLVVISVPPKLHMLYANMCLNHMVPCFIEASVTDRAEVEKLALRATEKRLVIAPSFTMGYFPGPEMIKSFLKERKIGKLLSINYQVGQYLPDWHPWESISEFYVSERETGGAKEIVPFELTWINSMLGQPSRVLACAATKLTNMDADIDDIYHSLIQYPDNVILNMTIDVISRPIATREMLLIGSEGKIKFSGDSNSISYCNLDSDGWVDFSLDLGLVEEKYIYPEEPYIKEMSAFVSAVKSGYQGDFPNNLANDAEVLKVLEELESINLIGQ
jgi:predicted dehydrogenase